MNVSGKESMLAALTFTLHVRLFKRMNAVSACGKYL